MSGGKRKFTLIELLVVVAIIAILAAMLLPALMRAKYITKKVVCVGSLKQVGVGTVMYCDDNDAYYPNGSRCSCGRETMRDNMYATKVMGKGGGGCGGVHSDMVSIMKTYYGGSVESMRDVFMCAVGERDYRSEMSKGSYLWYGTNSGQQPFILMWAVQGRDVWGVKKAMNKLGERWQQGRRAAAYENMWYNVVAGDQISPWQYGGPRATHYEYGIPAEFKETTCCGGYEYFGPTNGNFLTDDGAVKNTAKMWHGLDHVGGTQGYLVPAEYAEDSP